MKCFGLALIITGLKHSQKATALNIQGQMINEGQRTS